MFLATSVPDLMLLRSQTASASDEQVVDEDYHRDNKHEVNESAADVETETQKPQNNEDDNDCPKHIYLLSALRTPKGDNLSARPLCI